MCLLGLARHTIIIFHSWYFGLVALIGLYRIAEVDCGWLLLLAYACFFSADQDSPVVYHCC